MYANDWRGKLPSAHEGNNWAGEFVSFDSEQGRRMLGALVLNGYVSLSGAHIFYCPSDTDAPCWEYPVRNEGHRPGPRWDDKFGTDDQLSGSMQTSYSYRIPCQGNDYSRGQIYPDAPNHYPYDDNIDFTDHIGHLTLDLVRDAKKAVVVDRFFYLDILKLHKSGLNALFVDGHVKWISTEGSEMDWFYGMQSYMSGEYGFIKYIDPHY